MITFPSYANLGANDLRWKASNPITNFNPITKLFAGKVPRKPSCKAKWIVGPCYEGKMNREAQSQPLLECKAQAWSSKISKSTPVPKQLFLNRKSLYFFNRNCSGVWGSTWEQHYAATLEQNTCLSKKTVELLCVFDMEVSKSSLFAIATLRKIIQLRTES